MGDYSGKIPPKPDVIWGHDADIPRLDLGWKMSAAEEFVRSAVHDSAEQVRRIGKGQAAVLLKKFGAHFLGHEMLLPVVERVAKEDAGQPLPSLSELRRMDLTDDRMREILHSLNAISANASAQNFFQDLDDRSTWCVETLWLAKLHADSMAFRRRTSLSFMEGVRPDLRTRFDAVARDFKSRLHSLLDDVSNGDTPSTRLTAITTLSFVHADALLVEEGMADRVAEAFKEAVSCSERLAGHGATVHEWFVQEHSAVVALAKHASKFAAGKKYLADAAEFIERSAAHAHTNWNVLGDEYEHMMLQLIRHFGVVMDRLPVDHDYACAKETFNFISIRSKSRPVHTAARRVVHKIEARLASSVGMSPAIKGVARFVGPK